MCKKKKTSLPRHQAMHQAIVADLKDAMDALDLTNDLTNKQVCKVADHVASQPRVRDAVIPVLDLDDDTEDGVFEELTEKYNNIVNPALTRAVRRIKLNSCKTAW